MKSILTTSCAIHFGDTAFQALHSYLQSSNHSKIIILVDVNTKASCLPVLIDKMANSCLLYTSPSPRDRQKSRMPSSA